MANYLDTFFAEKDLDLDMSFNVTVNDIMHVMPYSMVVDAVKSTQGDERAGIEKVLRQIDFYDGDVLHFLRHLGEGLVSQYSWNGDVL